MMVTNCLFRWGAAAILLSNKPGRRFWSLHASLATAQDIMCTVVADIYIYIYIFVPITTSRMTISSS
jgi:hypothetical protein